MPSPLRSSFPFVLGPCRCSLLSLALFAPPFWGLRGSLRAPSAVTVSRWPPFACLAWDLSLGYCQSSVFVAPPSSCWGAPTPSVHVSLSLVVVFAVGRLPATLFGRFARWASPSGVFCRDGWPALFRGKRSCRVPEDSPQGPRHRDVSPSRWQAWLVAVAMASALLYCGVSRQPRPWLSANGDSSHSPFIELRK